MPKPRGGLGRGLGALIPEDLPERDDEEPEHASAAVRQTPVDETEVAAGIVQVAVESILPNPHQPRHAMPKDGLEELAASIEEHGVIQPLVVTRAPEGGKYRLIAGERRWRASMLAGLERVPAIVKEASSREMLELALVENLQRADLNPLEEANAYRELVDEFGLKQEEVAGRVGKSRGAVANALRLLRLPAAIQEALASGALSEGHARAILQVPDEATQLMLAEKTISQGLSVRQVEALARRLAEQVEARPRREETPLYDQNREVEDRIREALGTKVQLTRSSRGGRVVIYFYSDEELDRIYEAIVGGG